MEKLKFKPFDRVLVRSGNDAKWMPQWYSHKDGKDYVTMDGSFNLQCIPYEGNEDLYDNSDPYVEPYEPQDGDFLTMIGYFQENKAAWTCICKEYKDNKIYYYAALNACHELIDGNDHYDFSSEGGNPDSIRPATEQEKQLILSKLHEIGKDWDAEKKEIVDWKWKPKHDEIYYFPRYDYTNCEFIVDSDTWNDFSGVDLSRLKKGFACKSNLSCQELCDKLNQAIKDIK